MENGSKDNTTNNEVLYAPIAWRDMENITRQFDQTWGHYPYAGDDKKLSMLLSYHFALYLLGPSTRGEVAYKNGQFMGVLLSRVKGHPVMFPDVDAEMKKIDAKINSTEAGCKALADLESRLDIERRMERDTGINDVTSAEVELFLVSQAARGHGIGGELWSRTMDYFIRNNVSSFYLHTDSDCDVSFYDRHGLKRVLERDEMSQAGENHDSGAAPSMMYLYSGAPSEVKTTGSAR